MLFRSIDNGKSTLHVVKITKYRKFNILLCTATCNFDLSSLPSTWDNISWRYFECPKSFNSKRRQHSFTLCTQRTYHQISISVFLPEFPNCIQWDFADGKDPIFCGPKQITDLYRAEKLWCSLDHRTTNSKLKGLGFVSFGWHRMPGTCYWELRSFTKFPEFPKKPTYLKNQRRSILNATFFQSSFFQPLA
jgi:hypothetical protein